MATGGSGWVVAFGATSESQRLQVVLARMRNERLGRVQALGNELGASRGGSAAHLYRHAVAALVLVVHLFAKLPHGCAVQSGAAR